MACFHTPEDLAVYSYDGTFDHRPEVGRPAALHRTWSARVVMLAARERIPLVTRGMGSGLAAASVPFQGGIVLVNDTHEPDPGD